MATKDAYGAAIGRVSDRVRQQVGKHSGDLADIDIDLDVRSISHQANATCCGQRSRRRHSLGDDIGQRHALTAKHQSTGMHARELKQVLDHRRQPAGFGVDAAVVSRDGRGVGFARADCSPLPWRRFE